MLFRSRCAQTSVPCSPTHFSASQEEAKAPEIRRLSLKPYLRCVVAGVKKRTAGSDTPSESAVLFYLCVIIQFDDKLSHCAYSFSQTGYFSGSGILVIYALGSSLIDFACSSKKCSLCSSLVASSNCSFYLLNESFHFGSDCFVSSSSCLCYYDSFLCRFDVSQSVHLHIILKNYLCLFCIKAWTRTVQCKHTITF